MNTTPANTETTNTENIPTSDPSYISKGLSNQRDNFRVEMRRDARKELIEKRRFEKQAPADSGEGEKIEKTWTH